ncbi:MAG: hypothetical protein FWF10_09780 [Clostridiales bacterium]|nr:hypothetical protein [Clostridiales bacterium]
MELNRRVQLQEITTFIKKTDFERFAYGVDPAVVQAHLEDVALLYENILSALWIEQEREFGALDARLRTLADRNTELEQALQNTAVPAKDITAQENTALRDSLYQKAEALEAQRTVYVEKAEALETLLAEQRQLLEAARGEAVQIVALAQREAEEIIRVTRENLRRHTEKEDRIRQSITQKSRELQNLLQGLREQVRHLAREIDALQERAGELKMLRALREQVEDLAQELDLLQRRSEDSAKTGLQDEAHYSEIYILNRELGG